MGLNSLNFVLCSYSHLVLHSSFDPVCGQSCSERASRPPPPLRSSSSWIDSHVQSAFVGARVNVRAPEAELIGELENKKKGLRLLGEGVEVWYSAPRIQGPQKYVARNITGSFGRPSRHHNAELCYITRGK